MTEEHRHDVEPLDRAECLRLLDGETFGRVGVSVGALPAVLPVSYRLIGSEVVFIAGPPDRLRAAVDHAVIAFEVDRFDPSSGSGWSVLIKGVGRVVSDDGEQNRLRAAGAPTVAGEGDTSLVALDTDLVSGRRLDAASCPRAWVLTG